MMVENYTQMTDKEMCIEEKSNAEAFPAFATFLKFVMFLVQLYTVK